MKLKKMLLCGFLSVAMLFTACGGDGDEEITTESEETIEIVTDDEGNPVEVTTAPEEAEETTTEDENAPKKPIDVKVGFIYNGALSDSTLNQMFELARSELKRTLAVETCYIENVLVQQFDDAVNTLINEEGCNVIVSASNHFASACTLFASTDITGTSFISYGGENRSNVAAIQPCIYQPVNVAGFLSAYTSEVNKIGMVIDNNAYHAKGVANAFSLGVNELDHATIELNLNWAVSDVYNDTKKAIDDLVARGSDIIFLYQTTSYGIKYCESIGIPCIGFANNMPEIAPESFLTGYYVNFNNYIIERVSYAQYENFSGKLTRPTLTTGIVRMGEVNLEKCFNGADVVLEAYYDIVESEKTPIFEGEVRDIDDIIRINKGSTLSVDEIFDINWIDKRIKTVQNFSEPKYDEDLIFSDLEVIY